MPKRTATSSILIVGAGIMAVAVQASQPTVRHYGAWNVGVFATESEENESELDVSVWMGQWLNCDPGLGTCDKLEIEWSGGSSVSVSAVFDACSSRNGDLEQFYLVPVDRWKQAGRAMERQIENDFTAWLGQAALACDNRERAAAFNLRQLRPAVRAFTRILTSYR